MSALFVEGKHVAYHVVKNKRAKKNGTTVVLVRTRSDDEHRENVHLSSKSPTLECPC